MIKYVSNENEQAVILHKIALLDQEHRDLDMMINQATLKLIELSDRSEGLESLAIKRAKKRKLLLKDQITLLKSLLIPDIIA